MDILNYSTSFFDIPRQGTRKRRERRIVDFERDLQRARRKIKAFVKASRKSGYRIIGFIDKSISTKETAMKWKLRRKMELKSGVKDCVANMSLILGSIFQSLGVTVHYSTIDCDDTIAAFAYHKNGVVLSRDCDFFRYFVSYDSGRMPFQVYSNFRVSYGLLTLDPHGGPGRHRAKASPREILRRLPRTETSTYFLDKIPDYLRCDSNTSLMYKRGCGSNLTHEINPHIKVNIAIYI